MAKIFDRAAINAEFKRKKYIKKEWARAHGISDDTFKAYLYPNSRIPAGGRAATAIEKALKKTGLARYVGDSRTPE